MCADTHSDQQFSGPVAPHGAAGLPVTEAPARSAYSVGRVGALAVALGVGAGIMGAAAVAAADTGTDTTPGQAGRGAARSGDAGPAGASRAGHRQAGPGGRSVGAPSPAAAGGLFANRSKADGPAGSAARRATVLGSGPLNTASTHGPLAGLAALAGLPSGADPSMLKALLTPGGMQSWVQKSVTSWIGNLLTGSQGAGMISSLFSTPLTSLTPKGAAVSAVAAAPVMTAAASTDTLAASNTDSLAALGAGNTGDPLAAPLAWAALAVSRNEDLAGATPAGGAAAAVSTSAPADPASVGGPSPAIISFIYPNGQTGALVNQTIQIKVSNFTSANIKSVKFNCAADKCNNNGNIEVKISQSDITDNGTVVNVVVPAKAESGYVGVQNGSNSFGATYTINPAGTKFVVNAPQNIAIQPPGSGQVGDLVTVTGQYFTDATLVKFCGSAKDCTAKNQGVTAAIQPGATPSQIQVLVPLGATTGPIQVTTPSGNGKSSDNFTVISPTITDVSPTTGPAGTVVTITGTLFTGATSVKFGTGLNAVQATDFTVTSDTEIDASVPFLPPALGSPNIQITTPQGVVQSSQPFIYVSGQTFPAPDAPTGKCVESGASSPCFALKTAQAAVINAIATQLAKAIPGAGPGGGCSSANKCEVSPANYIAAYAFPVIYELVGGENTNPDADGPGFTNSQVGQQIVNLASQPSILSFISQTVTNSFSTVGGKLPLLPPAVATTIGNSVASFVVNSFGNIDVATAIVPFLRNLNIPTTTGPALDFAAALQTSGLSALLSSGTLGDSDYGAYNPDAMQSALVSFFGSSAVQQQLGSALASSIDVLLGVNLLGAPPAVADFVGEKVAGAVLGPDNPGFAALSSTMGTAFSDLFSTAGGVVATQAGDALATFLAQPTVGATLANPVINSLVTFLRGPNGAEQYPIPFPPSPDQPSLSVALAPAAGAAATQFVGEVLSDPTVVDGLGAFVDIVVPGTLGNEGVQDLISQQVSDRVSNYFGISPLGQAVGDQVGPAVATLLGTPAVSDALATFVNQLVSPFLGNSAVVPVLADAAGALVTAKLDGTLAEVAPQVLAGLRTNPAIDSTVGPAVTDAVAGFLGNPAVVSAVDSSVSSLVGDLFASTAVQDAVYSQVYSAVYKKLNGTQLAQAVAAQVAGTVEALVANPVVGAAVEGAVNVALGDVLGNPGVVTAFADAAGDVATAALVTGNVELAVYSAVQTLRANTDLQQAVGQAATDAVTFLFGDEQLWPVVDAAMTSLVSGLLESPQVEQALGDQIAAMVSSRLGDVLGPVVGPKVGTAVTQLLANPVVSSALVGLVDTVTQDFFGTPGVVSALAIAAGELASAAVAGTLATVQPEVEAQLRANPAIQAGVNKAVGDAVRTLLSDGPLWQAVDAAVVSLFQGLFSDPAVTNAIYGQVYATVYKKLNGTQVAQVVANEVATQVVSLVTDPVIQQAVLGLVDTVTQDFFGSPGVVDAFVEAADSVALAAVTTGNVVLALASAEQTLRENPDVDSAVQFAVGDAVTQLLENTAVWSAVDQTVLSTVQFLITNPTVLAGINTAVSARVEAALGEPLGGVVGPQIGAAVESLVANPTVQAGLQDVFDTLFSDFWSTQGVAAAFGTAAGDYALVLVTGGGSQAATEAARQSLAASTAVQDAVDNSVTAAVAQFLGDRPLWAVVDSTIYETTVTLLGDTAVQDAIYGKVYAEVYKKLNGTQVAQVVANVVAGTVVSLVTNPDVQYGLLGVVDTLTSDFWGSPGVVTAFSQAAGDVALAALTTGNVVLAVDSAKQQLRANTDVQIGVETAVGGAVTDLLTDPALWSAVDQTLSAAVVQLTSNPVVLAAVGDAVSLDVQNALGEPLGSVVGPQIGDAVVSLISNPTVQGGLHDVVDTLFSDFITTDGVVSALAGAASQYALVVVTGGDRKEAQQAARDELKASPAIQTGVDNSVTAAVAQLLGDRPFWAVVDSTVTELVGTLLGDTAVQTAIHDKIQNTVALKFVGPLGFFLGGQLGDVVVSLLTNPDIQYGLLGVFDTLTTDFWGSPGVVTAFSQAAGEVALAALTTGNVVLAVDSAKQELRANTDVQIGVETAVGGAVTDLLTDTALWSAVDGILSAEIETLTTNPMVIAALDEAVTGEVETKIGGDLGAAVAPFVGNAVVQLVTNQAVQAGLHGFVDTLFSDFISSYGVVPALAGAASQYALVVFTGGDRKEAKTALEQELAKSPAIDNGIDNSVGAAVTDLAADGAAWQAVGSVLGGLVSGVVGDTAVQQALGAKVATLPVVGQPLSTAIQSFMSAPQVAGDLGALFTAGVPTFFAQPGVSEALGQAAGAWTAGKVSNDQQEQQDAIAALRANTQFQDAVGVTVGGAVTQLATDSPVWQALGRSVGGLLTDLLDDSTVQGIAGAVAGQAVTDRLKKSPATAGIATPVGDAVATAVENFLAAPGVGADLGAVIASVIPTFFAQPGVATALGQAAGAWAAGDVAQDKQAQQDAIKGLRANAQFQDAVGVTVEGAVTQLIGDGAVWQGLGGAAGGLVTTLVDNSAVQQFAGALAGQRVTDQLSKSPATAGIAATVGDAVGTAVQDFLAGPGVGADLGAVIASVVPTFFAQPGVGDALGALAGAMAESEVAGTPPPNILLALKESPALQSAVGVAVGDVVTQLVGDSAVWQSLGGAAGGLVTTLVDNTDVQQFAGAQVSAAVTAMLTKNEATASIAATVGDALGTAVQTFLGTQGVGADLGTVITAVVPEFFAQPGLAEALGPAADAWAAGAVAQDKEAQQAAIAALRANVQFQEAVGVTVGDAVTQLVGDAPVSQGLSSAAGGLVTTLVDDSGVQAFAGAEVSAAVTAMLNKNTATASIAAPVGAALGTAVQSILAIPGMGAGLGDVVASVIPTFLSQDGVATALGQAADTLAQAAVAGDLKEVRPLVVTAFRNDPQVVAAEKVTIADALNVIDTTLLSDPAVQQGLGGVVTTLVADLAGNSDVQAYIGATLAKKSPALGDAVVTLLATPGVSQAVADVLGSSVTDFLGYPGFSTALTGSIDVFADEVLDGTASSDAMKDAVAFLRSNPVFPNAVQAIIPGAVATLLGNPAVQQGMGAATKVAVEDYLKTTFLKNKFIDGLVGQIAGGTVDSLLGQTAVIGLVQTVAVDVLEGMPISEVQPLVVNAVMTTPALQVAIGMSLGAGVGSLFGDNLFGFIVGEMAGIALIVPVSLTVALARIFTLGGPAAPVWPLPAAAAVAAGHPHGHHALRVTTVTLAVGGLDQPAAGSVGNDSAAASTDLGPIMLALRYQFAELFQTAALPITLAATATPQRV